MVLDLELQRSILARHILLISHCIDILSISSGDRKIAVDILKAQIDDSQFIIDTARFFKEQTTPPDKFDELNMLAETLKDEDIEMSNDDLSVKYSQDEIAYINILEMQQDLDNLTALLVLNDTPPLHYTDDAIKSIKKKGKILIGNN